MEKFQYPDLPPRNPPRKLFDRRSAFFTALALLLFLVLFGIQVWMARRLARSPAPLPGPAEAPPAASGKRWTPALQRQFAQKLAAEGLRKEAAAAFRQYLEQADVPNDERARVLYTLAGLHFEDAQYEAALAAFYQAEVAGLPEDIRPEVNRKVVACLERLGKSFSAQSELDRRTALTPGQVRSPAGDLAVARIGDETVTLGQLQDEIQRLELAQPQLAQALRSDPRRLVEFLRQYLFEKLLARKARKLGIDQQPDFRKQMNDLVDRSLAQILIRQEIEQKVKIDPRDVELYYQANRERYVQKGRASVAHVLLEDEETARKVLALAQKGGDFAQIARDYSKDEATRSEGGRIAQPLIEDSPDVPGIGRSAEFLKAAFSTPAGQVGPEIVRSPAGFHVLKVLEVQPSRPMPLEEAQQAAARDYQVEKAQTVIQRLIQETLEVERVQIFEDKILGPKSPLKVEAPE
ncbi:MAG: peptidyl-prolyl cis-trans isomerase [Planctomycetes bacterium]|nr:peptidyl-prolyl cis-trans isomerase [Planctomycetota bacterium]MBI3178774.1 peptidyl-prolyl cis-trans isomerase [Deltaproteobacteria bacterium]